jgi:hypothetical protein
MSLWAAAACNLANGQMQPPAILTIGLQDVVEYQDDVSDPSKFASNPGITPSVQPRNFFAVIVIEDIVTVNGEPARGTYAGRTSPIVASPTPTSGGAIADITRTAMREHIFELQKSDGTPVGTIVSAGFSGGPIPPGTGGPSGEKGNWAITWYRGISWGARSGWRYWRLCSSGVNH